MLDDSSTTQILRGRRIAVLVPCLNERETVTSVVHDFRRALPDAAIYVFDNGSTDGTAAAARLAGAEVRQVAAPGKGNVVRAMFREIEADAYVLVDGDDTYDAAAAPQLAAELFEHGLDMVVASRERRREAYTRLRLHGNDLLSELASALLGHPVQDLLSGYRVFSSRFAKAFPARSTGFEIETEMTFFASLSSLRTAELPTSYGARPQGSRSKLRTLRDGRRIVWTMLRMARERHGLKVLARHLRRTTLWGAAATALFVGLFLALNAVWWAASPDPMLQRIERSYAYEPTSIETSFEKFNDCLIPIMATLRRESALESIVTAERVYRSTRPQQPCNALRGLAVDGALPEDYIRHAYHQYWIGQRLFLQTLIPAMTVGGLRRFLLGLTIGLLFGSLLTCLWFLTRNAPDDPRSPRWRIASYGVLFAALLLFYGPVRQGASFTSAWPNALLYGFLLFTMVWPLGRLSFTARVLLVVGFGAFQAYFALMFGTIGLGLAAALFAAALDPAGTRSLTLEDDRPTGAWSLTLEVFVLYLCGALGAMLGHVVVAEIVYGESVLRGFVDRLAYRVSGDPRTTLAPELSQLFTNQDPSYGRMLERMDRRFELLGLGSQLFGRVVAASSLLLLVWSTLRVLRRLGSLPLRDRVLGVVLSGWVVPCWFVVFLEHTQTHARVMVRLWAWPIGCAAALILLAIFGREVAQQTDSEAAERARRRAESGPFL
ncbi:MAG: glycosyltransferase family 2 protein [Acidobacteriota bacterium]